MIIVTKPPAFSLTINSETDISFPPAVVRFNNVPVFPDGSEEDRPPMPCPPQYLDGRVIWVGKNGAVWRYNSRHSRWIMTQGPQEVKKC